MSFRLTFISRNFVSSVYILKWRLKCAILASELLSITVVVVVVVTPAAVVSVSVAVMFISNPQNIMADEVAYVAMTTLTTF